MRSIEVLVIGAGASGLVAAIEAARQGKKVLLVEKNDKLGKKILATGNGRCNFTNQYQDKSCYRSQEPEKAWSVLERFNARETIEWFQKIGILATDKDGYVYPASFQATAVQRALEREVNHLGIETLPGCAVQSVEQHISFKQGICDGYIVNTERDSYLAKQVILCTGGMAAPAQGSTGDGYQFAKCLGIECSSLYPALTSLKVCGDHGKLWAGCRVQGEVCLENENGEKIAGDAGELQFVSYGISGIPVFQISRFAGAFLEQGKKLFVLIDSVPAYSEAWLYDELMRRKKYDELFKSGCLLESIIPDPYAKAILSNCGISLKTYVKDISEEKIKQIVHQLKRFRVEVSAVSPFEKAQTTAGGVCLSQMNLETLEVHGLEGFYITGELLDVDGICGGYNLQWAWTTGIIAGRAAGKKEKKA